MAASKPGGAPAARRPGTPEADLADALRKPVTLGDRDDTLVAGYDEVLAWSREAAKPGGPTRILDVRTAAGVRRNGYPRAPRRSYPRRAPAPFVDLLTDEDTFRSVDEMVSLVRASGADPAALRATYCQGGVRAALVWFVLHELAGFDEVRSYAGSWEEWGNRADSPIDP